MPAARSLPRDNEAEVAILGCLMLNGNLMTVVLDALSSDDFYNPKNKLIFKAIERLYRSNTAIDYTTIGVELKDSGELDKIGGFEYLLEVSTSIYSTSNLESYIELVKKSSLKRNAIDKLGDLLEKGYDNSLDANEYITNAETVVFELSKNKKTKELASMSEAIEEVKESIERNSKISSAITGLDTGFRNLNEATLGLQPSNLIILAARPAMGKSAFAMNLAVNVAANNKNKQASVAVFNLEMSKEQLAERIIASDAMINLSSIRSGHLDSKQNIGFTHACEKLKRLNLWFDDESNNRVEDIRTKCRKLAATRGLDFVVIDYLQLINANSAAGKSRNEEVSEISRSLKIMARELNVPVLALSQLSRKVEATKRDDKRPGMADLRDSGAIEQDADIIMFLYRENYYDKENESAQTELIIAKNRSGKTDTLFYNFAGEIVRFDEIDGVVKND